MCFEEAYAAYHRKILRYLTRLLGPREAGDVAQEVFLKVDRSLHEVRDPKKLASWIYRIASNAALDALRKTARGRGLELESDAPAEAAPLAERPEVASAPLEREAVRREMNACIREVIDGLPGNYRVMIALSDLMGFTNAEIAERLGLSLETAKIRLHRARAKLKKALEERCVFYHDDDNAFSCDRKQGS